MRDISLKGVARQFGGFTEGFSVIDAIIGGSFSGTQSLHARLSSMAERHHIFDRSECIYGWRAGFQQTWTHIHVDVCLVRMAGVSEADLNGVIDSWRTAIEDTWSNRWACGRSDELACRLTFSVNLSAPFGVVPVNGAVFGDYFCVGGYLVGVVPGSGRANLSKWYITSLGSSVAHEYGHMLGLDDEYVDPECPDRNPVATGTIMDNNSNNIPARLMVRFANNIGSNVVPI